MSILDDLKALIRPQPTPDTTDTSWPQDDQPGYYDDLSVQQIVTKDAPVDQWAPTIDQNIPYRGVSEHGVPFDSSSIFVAPTPQAEALEKERQRREDSEAEPVIEEVPQVPVQVSVVEMPEAPNREMRIATNQWSFSTVGEVIRIAPRRQQRTKLTLVSDNGNCLFSSDQQTLQTLGFPIPASDAPLELDTTQAVYARLMTATDVVYVLEQFPVSTDELI